MTKVCVSVTVEVNQKGNGLLFGRSIELRLVRDEGRWRAECDEPHVHTDACDTMAEAVGEGTRQAEQTLQSQVVDRPLVAGKITPDMIPPGMF